MSEKKHYYKNPLDEHTCLHCATQAGKDVETVEEAAAVPFRRCTNENGCRCYVREVSEEKKKRTFLVYPGDPDLEFKEPK